VQWLRKKGLAGADKKAGRLAAEGVVATYIHPGSRLGVMVEVNCETDFVAASDKFLDLVNEVAMIIAASPEVSVVSAEDVSEEVLAKEREVEMGKEDLKSKPEAVRWGQGWAGLRGVGMAGRHVTWQRPECSAAS
jgi:elongation factor Ts